MSRPEKITCAGCLVLILLHLVASYFPSQRLWGVNLLYYTPPALRWILVISSLVILLPYPNMKLGALLDHLSRRFISSFNGLSKYFKYGLFSVIGGAVFWAFRVKTHLLGDSFVRAREIDLGGEFSFTAPLDYLIHLKVARLFNWDAFQTYAILSALAGVVFLFLMLRLRDVMGKGRKERFLVICVILTMGANLLFFGYVESYALVYVAMFAYTLSSMAYLNHKNGLALPVLLCLLTLSLHLSGLALLPSLLYLIFAIRSGEVTTERERVEPSRLFLAITVALIVAAGLLVLQNQAPGKRPLGYFLIHPLGSGESFYSLLSFSHLLDLVNHQLLISPVGILICLTALLILPQKIRRKDHAIGFLFILSFCSLGYAFLVDPKLGYPRDWDLFAFSGMGYTLLGLHLFLAGIRARKWHNPRYVALTLLFASLISTVPWIHINASEEKAVTRFQHLLDLDMERSAYGREVLAIYYDAKGEFQGEIEQWEKAIALTNSARYMNNLAAVYKRLQRYDLALRQLERSLDVDSTFDRTHFAMGDVLIRMGRYEEAIARFRKALKLRPDRTEYYRNLGAHLGNLGRFNEAIEVFQQGLRANPSYFPLYRDLGYTYSNWGDYARAEKYLKLYLEYLPQAEDAAQVRVFLNTLPQNSRPEADPQQPNTPGEQ